MNVGVVNLHTVAAIMELYRDGLATGKVLSDAHDRWHADHPEVTHGSLLVLQDRGHEVLDHARRRLALEGLIRVRELLEGINTPTLLVLNAAMDALDG